MLRRLPRLLRLANGGAAQESGCRRALTADAKGAHSVLDEVAQARLKRIKSQLEATGELPVEAPSSGGWRAVRVIWNTLLLGTLGTGAAAAYYTYAYTTEELADVLKRTRAEGKEQPLSQAWCGAIERYLGLRRNIEASVKEYTDPATDKLLPDLHPQLRGNLITLVLDLDELLVYKEWTRVKGWSIYKRPGVQDFLLELGQYFEIVVYTDEPATYTDPILNKLDPQRAVPFRLYRTDTQYHEGKHVRDLSKLNRDLTHVLMISAKPEAWKFQPENTLKMRPWKGEPDTGLIDLIPFLQFLATRKVRDVRDVVRSYDGVQDIPAAFKARLQEASAVQQKTAKRGGFLPAPR
ncbi:Mitochondrial import inner membrane translocase subunit TIM50 [Tetrabaena socialis]|uniref:Mitochondrial import inner membrane translocase subunit TIM50 n=1 Tax=Tetrabaena socialis TaxID=47790 RepID=A0A2J8AFH4_9CHLO|nr:Mitochondrial import inner membrane translocase subunit TIM50 [Tetrabaena socialis]|eukprot:PNH11273.1 Mitochondrial import inner membrane translocase subunit TIM50 [Tetrabaena socialis]